MVNIGDKLPRDNIVLTTGRDFKCRFEHYDENNVLTDFPPGTLFFEFATAPSVTLWTFTINGPVASLKTESEVVDTIPERTEWQLVFLPEGEPAGGDVLALGSVVRQGRRLA